MRAAVLSLALMLAASAAAAEDGKFLGAFLSWEAHAGRVGKSRVCYMSGLPRKSAGKYEKRGEASIIVTHWPGRKRFDEVSVVAGYSYKKGSKVEAEIDGAAFDLYTEADRAWRYAGEDRKMVLAMRKGRTLVVKGVSSRGTRTTDTYSLRGFTAAHQAINKACGAK